MAEDTEKLQAVYLTSPEKFHLEMPLYHEVDLTDEGTAKRIWSLLSYSGTIDAYCIWCEKESVFDALSYGQQYFEHWKADSGLRTISYKCTRERKASHIYYSYYIKGSTVLVKIGQFPSVANFQIPQAKKNRKVLGDERYKELTRGIGLAANGVGIGSFVYLRRIFASLIEEAHQQALKAAAENAKEFPAKEYHDAKMNGRISLLKDFLPDTLVENREIYGILSTGLHDLSEEECLSYFVAVRLGIEQILDEKIERKEKADKAKAARQAIKDLAEKVGRKAPSKVTP
jgi:hypothetical protein